MIRIYLNPLPSQQLHSILGIDCDGSSSNFTSILAFKFLPNILPLTIVRPVVPIKYPQIDL